MARQSDTVLDEPEVRDALWQAWLDSQPGTSGGHEEGGFVVQDASAALGVVRWPRGAHSSITMPSYSNCKVGEDDIVATFHTHPNAGAEYLQEPSATDRRAVKDDRDLKGDFYEGEFVLSQATVYLVTPDGKVSELGRMSDFFSGTSDD